MIHHPMISRYEPRQTPRQTGLAGPVGSLRTNLPGPRARSSVLFEKRVKQKFRAASRLNGCRPENVPAGVITRALATRPRPTDQRGGASFRAHEMRIRLRAIQP